MLLGREGSIWIRFGYVSIFWVAEKQDLGVIHLLVLLANTEKT